MHTELALSRAFVEPTRPAESPIAPPRNHVFVDFENIHHVDVAVLGARDVSVTLLLGSTQTKLDAGLVEALMSHASSVHLVRMASAGKNALDFTLAYYVGRAVADNPVGYFHIVSKDTGFDPLIEHLRSRCIHAHRHDSFETLNFGGAAKLPKVPKPPFAPPVPVAPPLPVMPAGAAAPSVPTVATKPASPSVPEPLVRLVKQLEENAKNRPGKKTTLVNYAKSFLGAAGTEANAAALVDRLAKSGRVSVGDDGKLTYRL